VERIGYYPTMLIAIQGRNGTFFRRIKPKNFRAMVMSVPDKYSAKELNRLHKVLWDWTTPARVSDDRLVELTIVDDQDDPQSTIESWEEALEFLRETCPHKRAFEYEDRNGDPHLGCRDCGAEDV